MIINQNFYFIDNDKLELRPESAYRFLSTFDDHNYLYMEIKWGLHKLGECLAEDDHLNRLINGDLHLILCNSHEAFHDIVQQVYQYAVVELKIPEHKILLLSESADILTEVKSVADRMGKQEIKTAWTRMFEWSAHQHVLHYQKGVYHPKLIDQSFSKAFLNFNRRWRLHRPALVALLYTNNLLDRGHISLAPDVDRENWNVVWNQLINIHTDEIKEVLQSNKDNICGLPPMYLDTTELHINQAAYDDTTEYLYRDSYFSVVSETNYYNDKPGRFLSEKVFKPIIMGHPFIIVSRPNSLDSLRELGYKTFSPYIDESYDTIEDNSERLLAIVKEIKRLSNLTKPELNDFLNGLRDICEYNYKNILNKDTFITYLN